MNNVKKKNGKVIIMTFGDPATDPRPNRMVKLFHSLGYKVDILCPNCSDVLPVQTHFEISRMHSARVRYPKILSGLLGKAISRRTDWISDQTPYCDYDWRGSISEVEYDFLVVEDLQLLPGAMHLKRSGKVIFDAREYYPLQNEESILWQIVERPDRIRLCKKYLRAVDLVLTVSPGLSKAYQKYFGVKALLFRSTPLAHDLLPRVSRSAKIRLVHHGVANKNRQLEKMIELMGYLDSRFELDMYLTGDSNYINTLVKLSNTFDNVSIKAPIPHKELVSCLNSYDIGIFYNEPTTFNLRYSLPNKVFEFIQARLAVAIAPSPDMKELVEHYKCGVVASDFTITNMASALNGLTEKQINLLKNYSHKAAQVLNFDQEKKLFVERINEMAEE